MSTHEMETAATGEWNAMGKPRLSTWLRAEQSLSDQRRLKALGNLVFPRCAALGINLIAHELS